jgi:hypothetical protein
VIARLSVYLMRGVKIGSAETGCVILVRRHMINRRGSGIRTYFGAGPL